MGAVINYVFPLSDSTAELFDLMRSDIYCNVRWISNARYADQRLQRPYSAADQTLSTAKRYLIRRIKMTGILNDNIISRKAMQCMLFFPAIYLLCSASSYQNV